MILAERPGETAANYQLAAEARSRAAGSTSRPIGKASAKTRLNHSGRPVNNAQLAVVGQRVPLAPPVFSPD